MCVWVAQSCPTLCTWTVAHQSPLSIEFSRQGYWSRLPFPPPGDLPNSGAEAGSSILQADSWLCEPLEKQLLCFSDLNCFSWPWRFGRDWSVVIEYLSTCVWCFTHDQTELVGLVDVSSHCIRGYMIPMIYNTSKVNHDHLAKVMSARFLYSKVTYFPFSMFYLEANSISPAHKRGKGT